MSSCSVETGCSSFRALFLHQGRGLSPRAGSPERFGIDIFSTSQQFKVQIGSRGTSRAADLAYARIGGDLLPGFDQNDIQMGVAGEHPVVVPDFNRFAVSPASDTRKDNLARGGRHDRRPSFGVDIHTAMKNPAMFGGMPARAERGRYLPVRRLDQLERRIGSKQRKIGFKIEIRHFKFIVKLFRCRGIGGGLQAYGASGRLPGFQTGLLRRASGQDPEQTDKTPYA